MRLEEALGDDPKIVVENKKDRVAEIKRRILNHLDKEEMSEAEAAELRGKLVFSNSQTYGRMGALAYHHLGRKTTKSGPSKHIDQDLRWALE